MIAALTLACAVVIVAGAVWTRGLGKLRCGTKEFFAKARPGGASV